jgi:hypothetical protein
VRGLGGGGRFFFADFALLCLDSWCASHTRMHSQTNMNTRIHAHTLFSHTKQQAARRTPAPFPLRDNDALGYIGNLCVVEVCAAGWRDSCASVRACACVCACACVRVYILGYIDIRIVLDPRFAVWPPI